MTRLFQRCQNFNLSEFIALIIGLEKKRDSAGSDIYLSRTEYTELLLMYSGTISFITLTVAMLS